MLRRRWSTVVVSVVGALALGAPQVASADISSPAATSFDAAAGEPFSGRVASFSSSFGDIDNFRAQIDWGDGSPNSEGSITSCPDCPNYGYYVDGSHTYQDVGSYSTTITIISLRDAERATAAGKANVTAPPPGPPPPGPPPQLGRVPVDFDMVRLRGPASLSARGLMRLVRRPLAKRGGELEQAPASEEFEATEPVKLLDCTALCGPPISVGLPLGSPGTTKPFSCCRNGQPDPQIAASNSYLVIGNRDTVWFYDKAGEQLYTKAAPPSSSPSARGAISNKSYPYTVPLCKLFKPLIPQMNAALDSTLPHQLDDPDGNAINVQNGYGLNCDAATGGVRPNNWTLPPVPNDDSNDGFYHPFSTIYDARVLWDEYHKRFWITALAYNTVTQRRVVHATWQGFQNQGTYNVAHSRRAMLAVAVSKSGDPRDGWELYWSWTTPDQTACQANDCGLYGAADFLRAGISSKYLVLNSKVNDFNDPEGTYSDKYGDLPALPTGQERGQIIVLPTEPVVTGSKEVVPVYSNNGPLPSPDGTSVKSIWPAVQHAPDFDSGRELFFASLYAPAGTPASYNVLLWLLPFDAAGAPQDMYQLPVEVNPFGGFPGCKASPVEQPSGDKTCIFGGGIPNYVAYRNGSLYTTFAECGSMSSGTCLYSALRFVRIQINGIVKGFGAPVTLLVEKAVDRSFVGPPNPAPPGNHAWYGFSGVDANKNGDAIIAYERSGSFVAPEARYSAYYKDEADVRASQLLMAGDSSFGADSGPHHYMGMSVDPFDKIGIWMIEGFAKNGSRSWAIGKALGQAHSDLQAAVLGGGVLKLVKGGPGAALYTLKLPLRNGGDGRAAKSVGRVHLVTVKGRASASRRRAPIQVKRFGVRRLAPGQSRNLKLRIRVPARARGYRYLRVALDTKQRLKEYGEQNNVIYVPLPKRRGR